MNRFIIVGLIFLLTISSIGCDLYRNENEEKNIEVLEAEEKTVKEDKFALIVKDKTNPYMLRMFDGFKVACDEIGAVAIFEGSNKPTVQGQKEALERVMESDVTAIAITANDADALEDVLIEAMAKGIKVISLDSAVNKESRLLHIEQASPEIIGRLLIQAACKMIEQKGKIAILSSTKQATNQNLWIDWMQQELKEYPEKYKDIEIVDIVYGDDQRDLSMDLTKQLLEDNPDLNIIIAPTVVGMFAAGEVIKEQESETLLTGLGLPSEMEPFIKDGICPWMYLWNPIDIGYLAVYTSKALVDGDIEGVEGEVFSAGKLGIKSVTTAHDGGMEVIFANPFKFDVYNISEWKSIY